MYPVQSSFGTALIVASTYTAYTESQWHTQFDSAYARYITKQTEVRRTKEMLAWLELVIQE